jgi:thymidylate synthase
MDNKYRVLKALQKIEQLPQDIPSEKGLSQIFKDHDCKNYVRLAKYLVNNKYLERKGSPKTKYVYTWRCSHRPNIKMVELIIKGVSKVNKIQNRQYNKSSRASRHLSPSQDFRIQIDQQIDKVQKEIDERRLILQALNTLRSEL